MTKYYNSFVTMTTQMSRRYNTHAHCDCNTQNATAILCCRINAVLTTPLTFATELQRKRILPEALSSHIAAFEQCGANSMSWLLSHAIIINVPHRVGPPKPQFKQHFWENVAGAFDKNTSTKVDHTVALADGHQTAP
eukprot:1669439-Amphidinium_carterae.1